MIQVFKLNPYPRRLWIVQKENFDEIKAKFDFAVDVSELTNEYIQDVFAAEVFTVSEKSTNLAGYLLFMCDEIENLDGTIAHEATHIVLNLYKEMGMQVHPDMDTEPLAYMVEYTYNIIKNALKAS